MGLQHPVVEGGEKTALLGRRTGNGLVCLLVCGLSEQCNVVDDPGVGLRWCVPPDRYGRHRHNLGFQKQKKKKVQSSVKAWQSLGTHAISDEQ